MEEEKQFDLHIPDSESDKRDDSKIINKNEFIQKKNVFESCDQTMKISKKELKKQPIYKLTRKTKHYYKKGSPSKFNFNQEEDEGPSSDSDSENVS